MLINDSESRFLMLEAEHVGLTVIDIASMLHKVLLRHEKQIKYLCFQIVLTLFQHSKKSYYV